MKDAAELMQKPEYESSKFYETYKEAGRKERVATGMYLGSSKIVKWV